MPPRRWISSLRESSLAGISFPSLVEMGWRIGTNREWGETPRAAFAHPPSLAHSRSRVYHFSHSSLCSLLLRLPFFPILLIVLTSNEATGRALVSLAAEVRT